jgi:hypothetical protein
MELGVKWLEDIPWAESEDWLSGNMGDGTLHDIYSTVGGDCTLPYAHASKVSRTTLYSLIDKIIADYRIQIQKQPNHAQPFFCSFLRYNASTGHLWKVQAFAMKSLLLNCCRSCFHRLTPSKCNLPLSKLIQLCRKLGRKGLYLSGKFQDFVINTWESFSPDPLAGFVLLPIRVRVCCSLG